MGRAPFSLTTDNREGTLVVTMAGELDMIGAEAVRALIASSLGDGVGSVAVDCSAVSFIDSVGVRSLLHLAQRCAELGVKDSFKLSPDVQRVLDMMGIGSLERVTAARPRDS